jgi:putative ABC transport system ATP-binding protein
LDSIVKVQNIERVYGSGTKAVSALKDISFSIERNQLVTLKGRSGSGKTTLLNIIGALDYPTNGSVYIDEINIGELSEKGRDQLRREKLAFIFQSFGLIPLMTVEENIEFGLRIAGVAKQEWASRTKDSIEMVRMTKRAMHKPYELSGGEQQRCAIARAIAMKPALILADEPTGELDTKTAFQVMKVFRELVEAKETTIIMTTHDPNIMELTDQIYTLEDGVIVNHEEHSAE